MLKWINKAEFIKVIKRHAFVNAQEDLNQEYDTYHDHEDEVDKIEWKTFKSIGNLEMLKSFLTTGWQLEMKNDIYLKI